MINRLRFIWHVFWCARCRIAHELWKRGCDELSFEMICSKALRILGDE